MNIPNILTFTRLVLTVFIVAFLLANTVAAYIAATVLFIAATITDFYDGYLAKKWNMTSDVGRIMDPIADKVLMLSVFAVLAHMGLVEGWMVIVIAAREVAVTASRLMAISKGQVLAAEYAGKVKTVFQMLCVAVALVFLIVEQSAFSSSWMYKVEMGWRAVIQGLMIISMILTVSSGYSYFKNMQGRKT